jgi:UDP-N-acetylmuramoylalanine--D-glutamate ligase
LFFPPTGEKIRAILKAKGRGEDGFLSTTSMEEAVRFAYDHTPAGTVCLLSTASPSYSVWKNFEEKGDQFQHWVHHYAEESHQENREIAHPTTQAQGETEGQSR